MNINDFKNQGTFKTNIIIANKVRIGYAFTFKKNSVSKMLYFVNFKYFGKIFISVEFFSINSKITLVLFKYNRFIK